MKLQDSFATYRLGDDEYALVSAQGSEFAGIVRGNEAAAFIIEELRQETSQEKIVQKMAQAFGAPLSVLERDVAAVVDELAAIGALEGADGVRKEPDGASGEARSVWGFEDELRERGSFVYRNVGVSMLPLIKQGRDLVVIGPKPEGRCRKYDVVLYRRGTRYVLHRIVEVLEDGYVICGDNCVNREYGFTDADIVGVMTAMVRNGSHLDANSAAQQRYARIWVALYPMRSALLRISGALRRFWTTSTSSTA
ncbi:MAG: PqqD family peptide modification chaperone [Eggerthellaceae bacterium]|nr:PqqD family peptide modification chaperone [Eggerthellaceae bacterium]